MSLWIIWSVTDYPGGKARTEHLAALWTAGDTAAEYAAARLYCERENRSRSPGETVKRVVSVESKAAAIACLVDPIDGRAVSS